jgi:beta-lactamase superfamily II metal-dependent hydrolase
MGFYIEMVSVGEGDCFLLTLDDKNGGEAHVLVDGGNRDKSDPAIRHINRYAGGHLNLVIGTHLDDDHIGGLIKVLESLKVDRLILNTPGTFDKWLQIRDYLKTFTKVASITKLEKGISAANDLLQAAKNKRPPVPVERVLQGKYWTCGDVKLNVLSPTQERLEEAWAEEIIENMKALSDEREISRAHRRLVESGKLPPPTTHSNDASIIIELLYNEATYALFPGDAGADVIREVTGGKSYKFLKVPHHGSKTGLDKELITQLKPTTAFIPVGENQHGHPSIEILDLLKDQGIRTFCSEKTKDCRRQCKQRDSVILCHRKHKESRSGFSPVSPKDCKNNPQ